MTKIYLNADSFTNSTRDADTDDEWDNGDTSTSWVFGNVTLTHPDHGWYDCFETPFDVKKEDILHLVVAIWSTGCTFGHNEASCMEVFFASKDSREAYKIAELLKQGKDENGEPITYIPWEGYFEHLNEIKVHEAIVE